MNRVKTTILAVIACLLWSTAFAGIKIGLNYMSPFLLAGIRFFLAGLILIPFSGKRYLFQLKENFIMVFAISLLQTVLMYGLFFTALTLIPGAIAAIIVGSSPLITAAISHILLKNDRFTLRKIISLIIGILGIVFVVVGRQSLTGIGADDVIGVVILLASIIFSALGNILISEKKKNIKPIFLNSSQLAVGGLILVIISLFREDTPLVSWDITISFTLLWLSSLSAVAFSIWFSLLKHKEVKVSELNMWKFLIPIFGAIFSWIVLPGESPNFISIVGMIVISGSILFYFLPKLIAPSPSATSVE